MTTPKGTGSLDYLSRPNARSLVDVTCQQISRLHSFAGRIETTLHNTQMSKPGARQSPRRRLEDTFQDAKELVGRSTCQRIPSPSPCWTSRISVCQCLATIRQPMTIDSSLNPMASPRRTGASISHLSAFQDLRVATGRRCWRNRSNPRSSVQRIFDASSSNVRQSASDNDRSLITIGLTLSVGIELADCLHPWGSGYDEQPKIRRLTPSS